MPPGRRAERTVPEPSRAGSVRSESSWRGSRRCSSTRQRAGTTGFDYATTTISDDIVEQVKQTLANIDDALTRAGSGADDDEGCIDICDRKKNLIISGGMNIYPAEIETALESHPDVYEAAVKAHSASFEIPRSIAWIDEVPKTGSGKTLERDLHRRYWVGRTSNASHGPPPAIMDAVPTSPMLRDDWRSVPHPGRLSEHHPHRTEILGRHAAALGRNEPAYPDPVSGLSVFTADFLALRGYCCDSGCRHCPFVV